MWWCEDGYDDVGGYCGNHGHDIDVGGSHGNGINDGGGCGNGDGYDDGSGNGSISGGDHESPGGNDGSEITVVAIIDGGDCDSGGCCSDRYWASETREYSKKNRSSGIT